MIRMGQADFIKPAEIHRCAICGNSYGCRTRVFYLHGGNLRCLVCLPCILSAGSGAAIMQMLEQKFPKLDDGRESRFKIKKSGGDQP